MVCLVKGWSFQNRSFLKSDGAFIIEVLKPSQMRFHFKKTDWLQPSIRRQPREKQNNQPVFGFKPKNLQSMAFFQDEAIAPRFCRIRILEKNQQFASQSVEIGFNA
jgi:hypothetical protein